MRPLATSWPPERRSATATGAAQRFSQTSTAADGARLERRGRLLQVVLAEQAGRRPRELGEGPALVRLLGEVPSAHRPVGVLDEERDVEDPDDAAIDEVQQQRHHLAGHRLVAGPLQHHVVDRAHLIELLFAHDDSFVTLTCRHGPIPVLSNGRLPALCRRSASARYDCSASSLVGLRANQ